MARLSDAALERLKRNVSLERLVEGAGVRILAKLIADSGHADRLARGRAGWF